MKVRNLLRVEITFFLSGLLAGVLFAWLVSRPTAVDFWFVQGNEFLIPRMKYWFVFGALLVSGLAVSYCLCVLRGWLVAFRHWAGLRGIVATLIVLIAFPTGAFTGSRFFGFVDPLFSYFLICVVIVSLISVALWLFTLTWKTWLVVSLLLSIPVAYILTIGIYKSLDLSNYAYDVLRLGFISGLLSGISGYWFATPRTKVQLT